MASTVLATTIEPDVFAPYVQELSLELSLFVRAGIIERNPALDAFLAGGGRTLDMPKWQDLADTEANISDDNGTAVIQNILTRPERGVRHNRNQTWGAMDLVSQLAGSDPMDAIARRVASYWVRQDQIMVLDIIKGLMLDADASILNSVSVADNTDATPDSRFTANALLDTFQLLGDHKSRLTAMVVHSVVHTDMQKLNLIDFTPDSEANVGFGTYMGKTILVDDGVTVNTDFNQVDTVTPNPRYSTIVFAPGCFQYGVGSPRVPAETDRNPLEGNGGGEEYLVSRREFAIHPVGFTWLEPAITGPSPTNAEMAADNAYGLTRAADSDNRDVRLAVLRTN